jgi:hypothetical protein
VDNSRLKDKGDTSRLIIEIILCLTLLEPSSYFLALGRYFIGTTGTRKYCDINRNISITMAAKPMSNESRGEKGASPAISRNQRRIVTHVPTQENFQGRCDDLKGQIYDCSDVHQAHQFTKTTDEIALYIGRNWKSPGDIKSAMLNLQKREIPLPDDPPADASRAQVRAWEKRIENVVKREQQLKENIQAPNSLLWGQCTEALRQRVASVPGHEEVRDREDGIELLKEIKSVMFSFQRQQYIPRALHGALRRVMNCQQGKHEAVKAYLDRFQNTIDVYEHCGGNALLGAKPGITRVVAKQVFH